MKNAVTALMKGKDGVWHYAGKPAHQLTIEKFLEGLNPGVVLVLFAPGDRSWEDEHFLQPLSSER
jgi:hypothetical protein